MKTSIALALIVIIAIISCGKDRFQTKPQLKFKSRNTDIVALNSDLRLNIEFTDKEGDVTDSVLIVRQRLNVRFPETKPANPYKIPTFPKTDKGEFEITMRYQFDLVTGFIAHDALGASPQRKEIDTLRLKIVARDKAGNKSDTLVIDNVYVCRDTICK
jgi:hypothetical protein